MKNIILVSMLLFACICTAQKKGTEANINKAGDIIGHTQKEHFQQDPFNGWFSFIYDDYAIDDTVLKQLKPVLRKVKIKAFMGTWCGDSQEQTPVFYKILDALDYNYKNLEMIAVNRKKKTPDNLQEGLDILRVPTFIFYKKGEEIGRIVEYPQETIEADMLKILSGQPYKHSYEDQ